MMGTTESPAREAYRMRCKHYGVDGDCHNYSTALRPGWVCWTFERGHVSITCTPDCNCARLKRYDKMNKK